MSATATDVFAAQRDRFPIDLGELRAKAEQRFNAVDAHGDGRVAQAVKVATRAWAARARGALATLTLAALLGCSPASDEPEHPGEAVYLRYCFSCHQAGRDGAPKLGDQGAWQPRIAQGRDAMLNNVKRGMAPAMPPRGACASCDDETLAAALDYMIASGND